MGERDHSHATLLRHLSLQQHVPSAQPRRFLVLPRPGTFFPACRLRKQKEQVNARRKGNPYMEATPPRSDHTTTASAG